jgi:WD40 repeat protein
VWDLATGAPVGRPFTGHDDGVNAVAAGELDGRPVVISGSDDATVRVWDLATGAPVGDPFTGHTGPVLSVAAGELDGRPVVISGSDDRTVRVWDLATGAPVGRPFTALDGWVTSVAFLGADVPGRRGAPPHVAVGAGAVATVLRVSTAGDVARQWEEIVTLEVGSQILALAWPDRRAFILATELGFVVFDLPDSTDD